MNEFVTACCCTYLRPELLGRLLFCWEQQDYPANRRELIIVDDANQYGNCSGNNWRIISYRARFPGLSEKRNASITIAKSDIICVADDDDYYWPHWISTVAKTLENNTWLRPSEAFRNTPRFLRYKSYPLGKPNDIRFHGSWAYRKKAWAEIGGYRPDNYTYQNGFGEDADFGRRMLERFGPSTDSIQFHPTPYYLFYDYVGQQHISSGIPYNEIGKNIVAGKVKIKIQDCEPFVSTFSIPQKVLPFESHPEHVKSPPASNYG